LHLPSLNGVNTSGTGLITLNVLAGVPVANSQSVQTAEGVPVIITLTVAIPIPLRQRSRYSIVSSPRTECWARSTPLPAWSPYTPAPSFPGTEPLYSPSITGRLPPAPPVAIQVINYTSQLGIYTARPAACLRHRGRWVPGGNALSGLIRLQEGRGGTFSAVLNLRRRHNPPHRQFRPPVVSHTSAGRALRPFPSRLPAQPPWLSRSSSLSWIISPAPCRSPARPSAPSMPTTLSILPCVIRVCP